MNNTPDIRIKVGAYTGVNTAPIYTDIKTIRDNINKSPLKIKLTVDVAATKQNITSKLNEIIGGVKLNGIKLDLKDTSSNIEKEISKGVKNGLKNGLRSYSGTAEIKALGKMFVGDRSKTDPIASIQKQLASQMNASKVSITGTTYFEGQKNQLKSFTATVISATGEVQKLNFELANIGKRKGFVQTDNSSFKTIADGAATTRKQIQAMFSEISMNGKLQTNLSTISKTINSLGQDSSKITPLLTNLENKLRELRALQDQYNSSQKASEKTAIAQKLREELDLYKQMESALKNVTTKFKNNDITSFASAKNINKLRELIANLEHYIKINDRLRTNGALSSNFDDLQSRMYTALSSGNLNDTAVSRLSAEYRRLQQETRAASLEGERFATRFTAQMQKLGVYFSAASAMLMLTRQIRNSINSIKELDKCTTDLQIATGKARTETAELLNTYSEMAKSLGATTVEVAQSADAWLRQGYNIEDTNSLIQNSMMLAKLGQMESADATKALTSSMKGYNISVEDSINIVDKFTATDMAAAVSAGYLSTAMAETATSARIAGVDINKLTGYIASVGEVTQDGAETVGNFYKTIFARMGNIKAGKLIDPESSEDLSDVEVVLHGLGIELRDGKKEFRNFGEVLDEVSSKWNTYSSVNQRAIAVAFSGTRQQEKFLTLMEHYGEAMKYAEIAANSAGTAISKYNNSYLKSIEASQENFVAQFEALSSSIWDSDFVKGTIDTGTGILGVLTEMTDLLGTMPTLIGIVAAAMSGISNKGLIKVVNDSKNPFAQSLNFKAGNILGTQTDIEAFKRISADIKNGTHAITAMKKEWSNLGAKAKYAAFETHKAGDNFDRLALTFNRTVVAAKAAEIGMKMLSMAMNMFIWMAVAKAVELVVSAVDALIVTEQEAIEAAQASAQEYKNLTEEITSLDEKLKTTAERIDELNSKDNLSLVEQAELSKLIESNKELELQLRIKKELARYAQQEAREDAEKVLDDKTEVSVDNGTLEHRGRSGASVSKLEKSIELMDKIDSYDEKIKHQEELLSGASGKEADAINKKMALLQDQKESTKQALSELIEVLLPLQEILAGSEKGNALDDLLQSYDKLVHTDMTDQFNKIFDSDTFSGAKKELEKFARLGVLDQNVLETRYPELVRQLKAVGISSDDAVQNIIALNEAVEETNFALPTVDAAIQGINSMSDGFEALDKVYADIKDKGTFDFSNLADKKFQDAFSSLGADYTNFIEIISKSPTDIEKCKGAFNNLINAWLDSKGVLNNLSDDTKDVTAAMLKNMGVANAEEIVTERLTKQKIAAKLATINLTGSISDQINTMSSELQTYGLTEDAIKKLSTAYSEAQGAMTKAMAAGVPDRMKLLKSELEAIKNTMDAYNLIIGKMTSNTGDTSAEAQRSMTANMNLGNEYGKQAEAILKYGQIIQSTQKLIDDTIGKTNINYTGGVKTNKESGKKNTKDPWLEAFKKELATLKHERAMDEISAKQYYTRLTALRDKYFSSNGKVVQKYIDEYRQYTEEIYAGGAELFNKQLQVSTDWISDRNLYNDWNPGNEVLQNLRDIYEEAHNARTALAELVPDDERYAGNVDLYMRPVILTGDGSYKTIAGETFKYSDFGIKIDGDSAGEMAFNVTPILPDGTEIGNLEDYIWDKLDQGVKLEDLDIFMGGGFKDIETAVNSAIDLHDKQAEIYSAEADALQRFYDITGTIDFNAVTIDPDNEIAAWERVLKWMQEQYFDKGLISHELYSEKVQEIYRKLFELRKKEEEDALNKQKDLLDKRKKALESIRDMVVEIIKKEKEDEIEALEEQKTIYTDIINAKKESLRLSERQRALDDKINESTDDISKLQAQADLLALDGSKEALAKRDVIMKQIAEKQKELNQLQHDDAVEKAEEALDKELDAFNKEKDDEIETIRKYLSKSGKLIRDAMDRIDREGEDLYKELLKWNLEYGDGIESTVTDAWASAKEALDEYGTSLRAISELTSALNDIDKKQSSKDDPDKSVNHKSEKDIIKEMQENGDRWGSASEAERKRIHEDNERLANQLRSLNIYPDINYDNNTGRWYKDKERKHPLYHNGLAGGFVGDEYTPKQNEIYALLTKDELVLNKFDQYRLGGVLQFADIAGKFIKEFTGLNTSNISNVNSTTGFNIAVNPTITINGSADRVAIAEINKAFKSIPKDITDEFIRRGYRTNTNLTTIKP